MKVILIILGVAVIAVPTVAILKFKKAQSEHLVNMKTLCSEAFSTYALEHPEKGLSQDNSCSIVANDEFMILKSDQNPEFEMVCYEHLGSAYSIEDQRCSIHPRS